MYAKVSISVTPGSDTLWSVHSGQRCWTMRLASSTRSWKRRSSRFGTGSAIGLAFFGDNVEREHEVARVVVAAQLVADVDEQDALVDAVEVDQDVVQVDARLPALQRQPHLVGQLTGRLAVGRGEDQVVDGAAELGPHGPLARSGAEDEPDALGYLPFAPDHGDRARGVGAHREGPAGADEVGSRVHAGHPPIRTFRQPIRM